MKKLKELYQQSLQELCHTKTVVLCGLLAALAIVLSMVASIQLGPYIKIAFSMCNTTKPIYSSFLSWLVKQ